MTTTLKPDPKRVTDLIRHLPDLLSGTEPILQRDQAREWIRQDPAMRLALVASGEVTRLLHSHSRMAGRFIRSVDPKLLSPIEFAKRHFNTRLMEALFEVCLYELSLHAEETSDYFATIGEITPTHTSIESAWQEWVMCCRSLGVVPDTIFNWQIDTSGASRSVSHRETAEIAINACDKLCPGANGIEFYRDLISCERTPEKGENTWRQYADRHRDRFSVLAGMSELALAYGKTGLTADALRLEKEIAQQYPPNSAVCLNGLVHSLRLGDTKSATHFARYVLDAVHPDRLSSFARALALNAAEVNLHDIQGAQDAVDRVIRILPNPIASALERAVA